MDYQILNLLFRCNKEYSHKKIRMMDFSDTECMICSYIYSHDNSSQDEVASALKTDKTTIAKAIASLEKKNCIIRTKDTQDKRINRLSLSECGRKKMEDLVNIHDKWLAEVMKCLSNTEQMQFENYCLRLLETANKMK